jgi:hypothetical protein
VLAASIAPDDRSVPGDKGRHARPWSHRVRTLRPARGSSLPEPGIGINDAEISTAGGVVTGAFDGKVTQLDPKSLSDEADFARARAGSPRWGSARTGRCSPSRPTTSRARLRHGDAAGAG